MALGPRISKLEKYSREQTKPVSGHSDLGYRNRQGLALGPLILQTSRE